MKQSGKASQISGQRWAEMDCCDQSWQDIAGTWYLMLSSSRLF